MHVVQAPPKRTLLLEEGQVNSAKLMEVQEHYPHHWMLHLEIEPQTRPGQPQVRQQNHVAGRLTVISVDCFGLLYLLMSTSVIGC